MDRANLRQIQICPNIAPLNAPRTTISQHADVFQRTVVSGYKWRRYPSAEGRLAE
jgi:hypothetical protein